MGSAGQLIFESSITAPLLIPCQVMVRAVGFQVEFLSQEDISSAIVRATKIRNPTESVVVLRKQRCLSLANVCTIASGASSIRLASSGTADSASMEGFVGL